MIDRGDFPNNEYFFSEITDPTEYKDVVAQTVGWYQIPNIEKEIVSRHLVSKKIHEPDKTHLFAVKDSFGQVLSAGAMDIFTQNGIRTAYMNSRGVRPGYEGKGLGTLIMNMRLDAAQNEFRCSMAYGKVLRQNAGALISALRSGFIIPDLSAVNKDHYTVYKSLSPSSQIDFSRVTNLEIVNWTDNKQIGEMLRKDYSIFGVQKDEVKDNLDLKMGKLPKETRRDSTWGFVSFG